MMPTVLVTGASGGIGSAVVARACMAGWQVLAMVHTSPGDLVALSAAYPSDVALCRGEVLQSGEAWHAMLEACRLDGRLDALVCCHGAPPVTTPSVSLDRDVFLSVLQIDLLGTFLAAQAVYPWMVPAGGSMVFLSSLHAHQTFPARVPYASAKAGVLAMARSLALEWGASHIRVNTVSPWQVAGPRTDRFVAEATAQGYNLLEAYKQRTPLRRLVRPEDVAEMVWSVLTNPSMTGQDVVLDCGVSASMWQEAFRE